MPPARKAVPRAPRAAPQKRAPAAKVEKPWTGLGFESEREFVGSTFGFVIFFVLAVVALGELLIVGIRDGNWPHAMNGFFWLGFALFFLHRNRKLARERTLGGA